MKTLFSDTTEQWALALVAMSGGVLFIALVMEHAFDMAPCPLCLMQRIWFFIAGACAFASLLHNPRFGIYPLCAALACIVGGGFSIRQLYLQSLPADQVPACGPDLAYMLEVFPLTDVLVAMTSGTGDCAEVVWSFLGLSIPGWALVGFVGMFVVAMLQLRSGAR